PQKRYREPLLANVDSARKSRELAKIRVDVPVDFKPDALRYRGASRERCFQIFTELGFRAFAHEYAPTADSIAKTYRAVTTTDDLAALVDRLRKAGRFALNVLTDRPAAMTAAIVGLAFSTGPRDADYVPIGHRALGSIPSIPLATVLDGLRAVLEDS